MRPEFARKPIREVLIPELLIILLHTMRALGKSVALFVLECYDSRHLAEGLIKEADRIRAGFRYSLAGEPSRQRGLRNPIYSLKASSSI